MKKILLLTGVMAMLFSSCGNKNKSEQSGCIAEADVIKGFARVSLQTDLSNFSEKEKEMLTYLFDAAEIMEEIFWQQAYPGKQADFLNSITNDTLREFAKINYGPWERLNGNLPFIEGVGEKPKGANFYPADMTVEEFEAFDNPDKTSGYTMIRRDENGKLKVVWYKDAFKEQIEKAAALMEKAAELSDDKGFAHYLQLRAKALRTDDYLASDMAWMDMKTSKFDFVIGPIENYEDALYGYKNAHEAFILLKDEEWSQQLDKFAAMLPDLQKNLPVEDQYKKETPGLESDMNVYEVLLYRGDCNAGSKTIAINLPNDERVHIAKGTRKLQLKNAMKAKFDRILFPISNIVMNKTQQNNVVFDAFFQNVTFHEVAHGMGIKNTVDGKTTVRKALKETYATIEELKADIMGLYLVDQLREKGEFKQGDVTDNYITFFAGIFRSIRFGVASAHGKANMMCFNYFADHGVFTRKPNGIYTVDVEKMREVSKQLLADVLKIQGDGDYAAAQKWIAEKSIIESDLDQDLQRIAEADIAKDIVFSQGKVVMGLAEAECKKTK